MDDIVYSFDEKQAPYAVIRDKDFKLLGFTLRHMEYGDRHVHFTTGKYSSVFIKFEFTRNLAPSVAQVYLPMILMVLLSFTTFLMKGDLVIRVLVTGVSIVGGLMIITPSTVLGNSILFSPLMLSRSRQCAVPSSSQHAYPDMRWC